MKFEINLYLYYIFCIFDHIGILYFFNGATDIRFDKKRVLVGLVIYTNLYFLLDIFLFDFTKSSMRSLLLSVLMIAWIMFVGNIKFIKSMLCML